MSVDDISRIIRIEDGEIRAIPEGNKNKWDAFITRGEPVYGYEFYHYRKAVQNQAVPFEQVTELVLEDCILQLGIDRIKAGRLPRQLK